MNTVYLYKKDSDLNGNIVDVEEIGIAFTDSGCLHEVSVYVDAISDFVPLDQYSKKFNELYPKIEKAIVAYLDGAEARRGDALYDQHRDAELDQKDAV